MNSSVVLWVMSIGFIGLGLVVALAGVRYLLLARASQHWPSVTGTVLRSGLEEDTNDDGTVVYRGDILYAYKVSGQEFQSNEVVWADGYSLEKVRAERRVARYPVGSEVTVYYDPNHVSRSILLRGPKDGIYYIIGAGSLFFLVGVGMAFFLPAVIR